MSIHWGGRGLGHVSRRPMSGGVSALPAGAVGVWYMDQYQSSPRPYIPNSAANPPSVNNLLSGSRGLFNTNKQFWFQTSCAVTDDAATGPDGAVYAATVIASASNWYVNRTINALPAGTYTLAINVKRGGASDETFKLQAGVTTSSAQTATSAWQRFALTFTHAGGNCQIFLLNNSTTASLIIDNFEMYSGSSDLGPEALAGHLYVGADAYNQKGSYAAMALLAIYVVVVANNMRFVF